MTPAASKQHCDDPIEDPIDGDRGKRRREADRRNLACQRERAGQLSRAQRHDIRHHLPDSY
jgi:hypothetical protein